MGGCWVVPGLYPGHTTEVEGQEEVGNSTASKTGASRDTNKNSPKGSMEDDGGRIHASSNSNGRRGKHEKKQKEGKENRTLRFRTHFNNNLLYAMRERGWEEWIQGQGELDWDIFWYACNNDTSASRKPTMEEFELTKDAVEKRRTNTKWVYDNASTIYRRLKPHQRVNHFVNTHELTRKDLVIKNIKRKARQLEKEGRHEEAKAMLDITPPTYVLPADYALFLEEFKRRPGSVWIAKPIGKAQGKGIFLLKNLKQVQEWNVFRVRQETDDGLPGPEAYIVQEYITNPHLLGGKKYDIRLYCLITSYSPLCIWLHRSGFARFSKHRFSLQNLEDNFVHLTNHAVQKLDVDYNATETDCKWPLSSLRNHLKQSIGEQNTLLCFRKIEETVVRTLLSVERVMISDPHCFELYGFDVLIDDALQPWLVEVNASPSMTSDTDTDAVMKSRILHDTFDVLGLEGERQSERLSVGGFDLLYKDDQIISQGKREGGNPAAQKLRLKQGAVCNSTLGLPLPLVQ